jgi:hypothetical protein
MACYKLQWELEVGNARRGCLRPPMNFVGVSEWMFCIVVQFLISIITLVVLHILQKKQFVLHVLRLLANFKLTTIQETGQY